MSQNMWIVALVIIAIVGIAMYAAPKVEDVTEIAQGAVFDAYVSIDQRLMSVVVTGTGTQTLVDVTTVPFTITVVNTGQWDFKNVELVTGTIPNELLTAFSGQKIASLPKGTSGTLQANVDMAALLGTLDMANFDFQAKLRGYYAVGATDYAKYGYSTVMPLTVYPGAGLTVTIEYE